MTGKGAVVAQGTFKADVVFPNIGSEAGVPSRAHGDEEDAGPDEAAVILRGGTKAVLERLNVESEAFLDSLVWREGR